jgi:hypothetical protein
MDKCCEQKCNLNISSDDQLSAFEKFWSKSDYNYQNCILSAQMVIKNNNHSKVYTKWSYKLNIRGIDYKICREFLINLYQISVKRLRTIQKKTINGKKLVITPG